MSDHTKPELPIADQLISVAIAIIYQDDKYLMQLRDNIPNIAYPGVWGLFGGHLETDEAPQDAVARELLEEINYSPPKLTAFRSYGDEKFLRHVFSCPLTVALEELELNEGEDFSLLTLAEIEEDSGYSAKLCSSKPLGDIHRQIILDFAATQT